MWNAQQAHQRPSDLTHFILLLILMTDVIFKLYVDNENFKNFKKLTSDYDEHGGNER